MEFETTIELAGQDYPALIIYELGPARQGSDWQATFQFQILTPEYISRADLLETLNMAGRLIGIGDFRPTFGRFQVSRFAPILN